jgi:hypothetical protein
VQRWTLALGSLSSQVPSSFARYIAHVQPVADGLLLSGEDGETVGPFDEAIGATGFRPDLGVTRELRLGLDPSTEAPMPLAPLIDPNATRAAPCRYMVLRSSSIPRPTSSRLA